MSWRERTAESVTLTSPSGEFFTALWPGGRITGEKKVAVHDVIGEDGAVTQDLGLKARKIPLSLFFDGPDCDAQALKFEKAFFERGPWKVTHPVVGMLSLQPLSYEIGVDPVGSAGVVSFKVEFLESANQIAGLSGPHALGLEEKVAEASEELSASLLGQLRRESRSTQAHIRQSSEEDTSLFLSRLSKPIEMISQAVSPPGESADLLYEALVKEFSSDALDVAGVFGGVSRLLRSPTDVATDIGGRARLYRRVFFSFQEELATTMLGKTFSTALFQGAVSAMLGGSYEDAVNPQASLIYASQTLGALYKKVSALHEGDEGAGEISARLDRLHVVAQRTLLSYLYSLSAEKRVIVSEPTPPLLLFLRENRGAPGDLLDEGFDRFLAVNRITGEEVLLLPRGREVVFRV